MVDQPVTVSGLVIGAEVHSSLDEHYLELVATSHSCSYL